MLPTPHSQKSISKTHFQKKSKSFAFKDKNEDIAARKIVKKPGNVPARAIDNLLSSSNDVNMGIINEQRLLLNVLYTRWKKENVESILKREKLVQ